MNCKYHLHKKALWHCNHCDTPFCIDCCDVEPGMHSPRCLLCRNNMDSYGISDQVEPFWNKLNDFAKYALHKNAIRFVATFLAICVVAGFVTSFLSISILTWLTYLALYFILISYSLKVVTKVARGDFEAPTYDEAITFNDDEVGKAGLALDLFISFYFVFLFWFQMYEAVLISAIAFALLYSAMIINLAMTRHLSSALMPNELLRTIIAIGFPYLLLKIFIFLLGAGLFKASVTIYFWFPGPIAFLLIFALASWTLLYIHSMLGYAVYQYHAELGYGIDAEQIMNNENVQQVPELRKLAHADVYIQEGRFDDAESALYDAAKNPQYSSQALERLIKLNMARKNPVATVKAARAYYEQKDLFKHAPKALALYQEIDSFEPRFKPMNANARAILIGAVRNPKLLPVVEKLTTDMQEKLEQDPDLAKALSAEAKFYAEVMNDDDKAIDLLKQLLDKFPHGSHKIEAERLLGVCMNMKQTLSPNP